MKKFNEMNVIPLIDVMLVLLAIVLITASFIVHDSLQIDLPDTDSTSAYEPLQEESITLAIDAEGLLFIDEELTKFTDLNNIFSQYKKDTYLIVKVDTKTEFGYFIKLVDILKANDLTNLVFLTDKSE